MKFSVPPLPHGLATVTFPLWLFPQKSCAFTTRSSSAKIFGLVCITNKTKWLITGSATGLLVLVVTLGLLGLVKRHLMIIQWDIGAVNALCKTATPAVYSSLHAKNERLISVVCDLE